MVRNPILLYNSGSLPVSRNATTARWSNHGDTVRVEKAQRMVVAAMHVRQNRQVLFTASFATGAFSCCLPFSMSRSLAFSVRSSTRQLGFDKGVSFFRFLKKVETTKAGWRIS